MKTPLFTQIIHFLFILFLTSENLYASNVVRYICNKFNLSKIVYIMI